MTTHSGELLVAGMNSSLMYGFVLGSVHNFMTLSTMNGSLDLVLELHGVC